MDHNVGHLPVLLDRDAEFRERFTPGGNVIYVGDTGEKFAHFDRDALAELLEACECPFSSPREDYLLWSRQSSWVHMRDHERGSIMSR